MAAEGEFPKVDGDILYGSEVNSFSPLGTIIAWVKTFGTADSGTTDGSTTTDKLIQSGQNFQTTIKVNMIIHNTTDDTFANVTAIDSDTILSIDSDIMATGENYVIYKTTKLPDYWVECNGQALSDADSPYNGETIPDLNASSGTERFLRGKTSSGGIGGTETHTHVMSTPGGAVLSNTGASVTVVAASTSTLPSYYEIVWIMKVR